MHVSPKFQLTPNRLHATSGPSDSKPVKSFGTVSSPPSRGEPRQRIRSPVLERDLASRGYSSLPRAQVQVELRPRQLSGLARSPTPGGGGLAEGSGKVTPGRTGRSGKRVPRRRGRPRRREARARRGTRSGPRPGCPPAAGAHRAGGWTEAASARLEASASGSSAPGRDRGRADGRAPPPTS